MVSFGEITRYEEAVATAPALGLRSGRKMEDKTKQI